MFAQCPYICPGEEGEGVDRLHPASSRVKERQDAGGLVECRLHSRILQAPLLDWAVPTCRRVSSVEGEEVGYLLHLATRCHALTHAQITSSGTLVVVAHWSSPYPESRQTDGLQLRPVKPALT